ncbi:MAG TPA: ABC transporter permease [Solirubrobacteraceae bacterium]|jgi:putative ABC transport system permease protein|nr:ABC transporter permease [Solirubrobacteraceae bacterium]
MGVLGIAIGVALFFGVLLTNVGVTGPSTRLVHELTGTARYTLSARSSDGFDERLVAAVGTLPDVQVASPILLETAAAVGPKGHEPVEMLGLTPTIVMLEGEATRNLGAGAQTLAGGIGLPEEVARRVGARAGRPITILAGGRATTVQLRAVLGPQTIGAVANSSIAVGLLPTVQRISGVGNRVSSILVKPAQGTGQTVREELVKVGEGRLDVTAADHETRLLQQAAKPSDQSTMLFAAIGAMVGFLLALNAALITTPERRRFTAEMRTLGFTRRYMSTILAFQATILGVVGSAIGIGIGYLLFQTVFHSTPGFLTSAFLIGSREPFQTELVLPALACGILAALAASMPCFLDIRSDVADAVLREPDEAGQQVSSMLTTRLALTGAALIAMIWLAVTISTSLTIVAGVLLAMATLCFVPATLSRALWLLDKLGENLRGSALPLAAAELSATATRSAALTCIIALAVYGSVAVGGARHDLLRGLDQAIVQEWSAADAWVTPDEDIFDTDSFDAGNSYRLVAAVPAVASVHAYQGGFLDVGDHRLWIRARPADNQAMILSSQLTTDNLALATARLREGGWATVSGGFASERHLSVGDSFALPTPTGTARFAVAGITTNIGWPSGTITINTNDYRRYWASVDPTTLAIDFKPGTSLAAGVAAVASTLHSFAGLRVQTSAARIAGVERTVNESLETLGQIATMLLVAAALAVAAALSAAIWQRRAYLASLKAQGFDRLQLWRAIVLEASVLILIGGIDGTVFGVYGHTLASRWLRQSTGFPTQFSLAQIQVLATLALVVGIALLVILLPGLSAVQVPTSESFQE